MESLVTYLGWVIAALAVIFLLVQRINKQRDPDEPITVQGVLEDGIEVITEAMQFTQEIVPAAKPIVEGLRQQYLNGDLNLEELKDEAMTLLTKLFPDADPALLEKAVEGTVFASKVASGELWYKKPEPAKEKPIFTEGASGLIATDTSGLKLSPSYGDANA